MPIQDRVAAAKKVDELLRQIIATAGFKLKYRITAHAPSQTNGGDNAEIRVELAGPDSSLVTARNAELLRAFEHIAVKSLRLQPEEHERISFDCNNYKTLRLQELKMAARVAAEKVRASGRPYEFAPMSSRERRLVHLAMKDYDDLRSQSSGEGPNRAVVVYPKDYTGAPLPPRASARGFGRRH